MTRFQRVIADRCLVLGTWYSDSDNLLSDVETDLPYLEPPKVVPLKISTAVRYRFTALRSQYEVPNTQYRLFIGFTR